MTDVILIQQGKAWDIFPNFALAQMTNRFHPNLVAVMVEVPSGTVNYGDLWDGATFSPPPPPGE